MATRSELKNSRDVQKTVTKAQLYNIKKQINKSYCNSYVVPYLSTITTNPLVLEGSANNTAMGKPVYTKAVGSDNSGPKVNTSSVGLTNDRGFINYKQNTQYYTDTINRLNSILSEKGCLYDIREVFLEILSIDGDLSKFCLELTKNTTKSGLESKYLYDLGLIDLIRPLLCDGKLYVTGSVGIHEYTNTYQGINIKNNSKFTHISNISSLERDSSNSFLRKLLISEPEINIGIIGGVVYTTTRSILMNSIDRYQDSNTFELPCTDIISSIARELLLSDFTKDTIRKSNENIPVNEFAEEIGGKYRTPRPRVSKVFPLFHNTDSTSNNKQCEIGQFTISKSLKYNVGANYFPHYSIQRGSSDTSGFNLNMSLLYRLDKVENKMKKEEIRNTINHLPPMGDIIPLFKLYNYNGTIVAIPLSIEDFNIYPLDSNTVLYDFIKYIGHIDKFKDSLESLTSDMISTLNKDELFNKATNSIYKRFKNIINSLGKLFIGEPNMQTTSKKSLPIDDTNIPVSSSISIKEQSTPTEPIQEVTQETIQVLPQENVQEIVQETVQVLPKEIAQPNQAQEQQLSSYKCGTRLKTDKKFTL